MKFQQPFYDPTKSYEDNYVHGPFGGFVNPKKIEREGKPKYDFFGHKLKMNYKIIGVGGVSSKVDFDKYKKLGADVVMSATAAMWNTNLAKELT